MKTELSQLWLTCANSAEADKIANTLLVKHFILCAKQISAKSNYRWQGKIEQSDEVLLIMDSKPSYFKKIETEIAKLHSYDTFVLQEVPVAKISTKAKIWVENELVND